MAGLFRQIYEAIKRAIDHDQFGVAKGVAYSLLMTIFPAALLLAAIFAMTPMAPMLGRGLVTALGRLMPPDVSSVVLDYFKEPRRGAVRLMLSAATLTLWTGSGAMASWMDGFRRAYEMPRNIWTMTRERLVAFELVLLAGAPMAFASCMVAFGRQIETWMIFHSQHEYGPYILGVWAASRWILAMMTSVAVISLIFHNGLPRTQPWHRVLPGAVVSTVLWYLATVGFGYYVRNFANYGEIYGSLGTAIALMVWLYLISTVVLIGAEFNALRRRSASASAEASICPGEPI